MVYPSVPPEAMPKPVTDISESASDNIIALFGSTEVRLLLLTIVAVNGAVSVVMVAIWERSIFTTRL